MRSAPPPGRLDAVLHGHGFTAVAGCDEAGRGALAGPLVAAAVILPPGWVPAGLTDSKLLTALQRERLFEQIREHAVAVAVRRIGSDRVDRMGLHQANLRALRDAVSKLEPRPDYVLVDGFRLPRLGVPSLRVIKGDLISAAVAAASVVAKVSRDRSMVRLHREYRQYRPYAFDSNKGYRSPEHLSALDEHGPCPEHRRCFREVAQLRLRLDDTRASSSPPPAPTLRDDASASSSPPPAPTLLDPDHGTLASDAPHGGAR